MPFIGNQPALSYTSFAKQDFTTSATTSYTLDHPVANGNEIALFINFVRQEPTAAYTASGTSLTLTSATSASDDMYCVFLGKAVQTVNPPNSSVGTSQLDSSLDFSSKTITLADNMKNTPAFMATNDSTQSVSSGTWTELSNYDRVVFNTGSNYSASTNRFTPTVAGKYFFYASVRLGNISAENYLSLNKNGATSGSNDNVQTLRNDGGSTYSVQNSCIFDMNGSTDYVSVFVYQASGSNQNYGDTDYSYGRFLGYRIIGA